jgi:serine/threonine protein kinase
MSPGLGRPVGDFGGFAGFDEVIRKSKCPDQVEDVRFARLADVCEMSDDILGIGGFGIVRRGHHKASNAECAVKIVCKSNDQSASWLRREAEVLKRLEHLHVCKLLDSFEDEDNSYLVLELVQGSDLCNAFNDQLSFDESSVARIMQQIFEALAYCHKPEISVIHRDLKPENVMLQTSADMPPTVKLIDFGLATQLSSGDFVQTDVVGTAEFLAPEALSRGVYSRASDMWSAGVILHMLLTGGALPSESRVSERRGLSEACTDLLEGLLRDDPSERLTAAEACKHPWIVLQCVQECEASVSAPSLSCNSTDNVSRMPHAEITPACGEPMKIFSSEVTDSLRTKRTARRGGA